MAAGLPRQLLGQTVSYKATGTLKNSVLDGSVLLATPAIGGSARGMLDLGQNLARGLQINARIKDPGLLGPGTTVVVVAFGTVHLSTNAPFFREIACSWPSAL